jgi:hypothetical protein
LSSGYLANWDKVKHGVPPGSMCGPLLFLFYIDLPEIIKINSKPVPFADDTSLIITNASPLDFKKRYHHCICSTEK